MNESVKIARCLSTCNQPVGFRISRILTDSVCPRTPLSGTGCHTLALNKISTNKGKLRRRRFEKKKECVKRGERQRQRSSWGQEEQVFEQPKVSLFMKKFV